MSQNIQQVYTNNPITTNASTDLMYFGQSPYGAGNDAAMTYANFSAQFSPAGSGTVNTGTAQQVGYYASSGKAISGLTVANNSALIANGSGSLASLGYSTIATASNLVERDSAANIFANNDILNQASNAAGGTVTLTNASAKTQIFSGAGSSTLVMPNATTLALGFSFYINNNSSGVITVQNNDTTTLLSIPSSQYVQIYCTSIGTTNGTFDWHWLIPAAMSNGQVVIGGGTSGPKNATLTAGSGISITNAANSITIASITAGMTWSTVTGTTQSAAVNNGYITNNASAVTVTLPTTFAIGDTIEIKGLGAGGWILAAGTATTIRIGSSVTSSAGSLTSANQYDTVRVTGLVANTTWSVDYVLSTGLTIA